MRHLAHGDVIYGPSIPLGCHLWAIDPPAARLSTCAIRAVGGCACWTSGGWLTVAGWRQLPERVERDTCFDDELIRLGYAGRRHGVRAVGAGPRGAAGKRHRWPVNTADADGFSHLTVRFSLMAGSFATWRARSQTAPR